MANGWIGVDLDGTLARNDDDSLAWEEIGAPIAPMVRRIREWLAAGQEVRIMTARVCWGDPDNSRQQIEEWCFKLFGQKLEVTSEKDYEMLELWDDRAVQVIRNTGRRADGRDNG